MHFSKDLLDTCSVMVMMPIMLRKEPGGADAGRTQEGFLWKHFQKKNPHTAHLLQQKKLSSHGLMTRTSAEKAILPKLRDMQ